jgi:predicted transcriptional regulator
VRLRNRVVFSRHSVTLLTPLTLKVYLWDGSVVEAYAASFLLIAYQV